MSENEMTAAEYRKRLVNNGKQISLVPEKKVKKSKYHAVKKEVDGFTFDSIKEADYYSKLVLLQRSGEIIKIERQVRYEYLIIYTPRHTPIPNFDQKACYIADFRITYKDGMVEVVDTKGFMTAIAKRKIKIVKKLFGIDVKIV